MRQLFNILKIQTRSKYEGLTFAYSKRKLAFKLYFDKNLKKCLKVILQTRAMDKKQHNHELEGDYLKLMFLAVCLSFCLKIVLKRVKLL